MFVGWRTLSKRGRQVNGGCGLVLGCTNKRNMACRVRARGLQQVCRQLALTRRYRESLQSSTSSRTGRMLILPPRLFPFTPSLSPSAGERGNPRHSVGVSHVGCHRERRASLIPLPRRGGEGIDRNGAVEMPLPKHPTSNIQHRTPNIERPTSNNGADTGPWMFDVGCWVFSIFGSGGQGAPSPFRGILSLTLSPLLRRGEREFVADAVVPASCVLPGRSLGRPLTRSVECGKLRRGISLYGEEQ
jgi:hypothetical protein